jgi:hypothetical protein
MVPGTRLALLGEWPATEVEGEEMRDWVVSLIFMTVIGIATLTIHNDSLRLFCVIPLVAAFGIYNYWDGLNHGVK